jgi:hypothetical protein
MRGTDVAAIQQLFREAGNTRSSQPPPVASGA